MSGHNDIDRLALFAAAKCCRNVGLCVMRGVFAPPKPNILLRAAPYRRCSFLSIWSQHSRQLDNLLGAFGDKVLDPLVNVGLEPCVALRAYLDGLGKLSRRPHAPQVRPA